MNNGTTHLLIGGPSDGQRIAITHHREQLLVPLPAVMEKLDFARLADLDPIASTPATAAYYPERLRGRDFEVILYRHESLNVDQMLDRLVARYPNETTQ